MLELDGREASRVCWRGMEVGRGQQEVERPGISTWGGGGGGGGGVSACIGVPVEDIKDSFLRPGKC